MSYVKYEKPEPNFWDTPQIVTNDQIVQHFTYYVVYMIYKTYQYAAELYYYANPP